MAGPRDRRLSRWPWLLVILALVALAVGACHPQEPPGKRDGAVPRHLT
jgi:hypothetical protein